MLCPIWGFRPAPFVITRHGGDVIANVPLDGDAVVDFPETYTLTIVATDQAHLATPPQEQRSTSTTLVVTLLDENDNVPQLRHQFGPRSPPYRSAPHHPATTV